MSIEKKSIKKKGKNDVFKLKELKIGGQLYKIKFVNADDIEHDCGECNRATTTIKIRKDMSIGQTKETLIHEIIHAINSDLSELAVDAVAHGLYQVYKDNLDLV